MNNTEIEMVLRELLKEVQTTKAELSLKGNVSSEEKESRVSHQLESIVKGMATLNDSIKILTQRKSSDVPKIDYTPILRFEEQLKAFKRIHELPPPTQTIRHEHSFKNWHWLAMLFLFIGLSVLLGWYALDDYYQSKDLKVKYGFVRKEMPEHIRQLDSTYQVNPDWVEKYKGPAKEKVSARGKKKK